MSGLPAVASPAVFQAHPKVQPQLSAKRPTGRTRGSRFSGDRSHCCGGISGTILDHKQIGLPKFGLVPNLIIVSPSASETCSLMV
jgi:hypothetical protein